jgi:hypothetical protein
VLEVAVTDADEGAALGRLRTELGAAGVRDRVADPAGALALLEHLADLLA